MKVQLFFTLVLVKHSDITLLTWSKTKLSDRRTAYTEWRVYIWTLYAHMNTLARVHAMLALSINIHLWKFATFS